MGLVRVGMLLGILVAGSCVRLVTPPRGAGGLALGARCQDGGDCGSGVCGDGVCCEAACGRGEACNLRTPGHCEPLVKGDPCTRTCSTTACAGGTCCGEACDETNPLNTCGLAGHVGACITRVRGNACDADNQCPQGDVCEDHVCCSSHCGQCRRCDVAGEPPGECANVAPNTDPDFDCNTQDAPGCWACFSGLCLPATPGTDPLGACPSGLVCGTGQECALPNGAACTSNDQCAHRLCLGRECTLLEQTPVQLPASAGTGLYRQRRPLELAATPGGDVSLILVDSVYQGLHTLSESRTFLHYASRTGRWKEHGLDFARPVAGLTTLGEYTYFLGGASAPPSECTAHWTNSLGVDGCSLVGMLFDADGNTVSVQEDIRSILTGVADEICLVRLTTLQDNSLLAVVLTVSAGRACSGATYPADTYLLLKPFPQRTDGGNTLAGDWRLLGNGPVLTNTGTVYSLGQVGNDYALMQYSLDASGHAGASELDRFDAQGTQVGHDVLPPGPCLEVANGRAWFSPQGDNVAFGGIDHNSAATCLATYAPASGWTLYNAGSDLAAIPLWAGAQRVRGLTTDGSAIDFLFAENAHDPIQLVPLLTQSIVFQSFTTPLASRSGATVIASAIRSSIYVVDPDTGTSVMVSNIDSPFLLFLR